MMRSEPRLTAVFSFLLLALMSLEAHAATNTIESNSVALRDSVRKGDTPGALRAFAGISNSVLTTYEKIGTTDRIVDRFVEPVDRGLSALSGDAVVLEEFQKVLDRNVDYFKSSYQFEELALRDYGLETERLEALSGEGLISEYSQVSRQVSSDIHAYDREIERLQAHKGDLESLAETSRFAEDKATEVEALLNELNAKGISVLARTDLVWKEFALYIQPRLIDQTTEIENAIARIDGRLENLSDLRRRADVLRQWVDYSWWYEAFRLSPDQADGQTSVVPGMGDLETASSAKTNAGTDASGAISKLLSDARAATNIANELIQQLAAEGAKKDSDAAKSLRVRQLLGAASTVLSAGNTIGKAVPNESSGTAAPRVEFGIGEVEAITPIVNGDQFSPEPLDIPQELPESTEILPMRGLP